MKHTLSWIDPKGVVTVDYRPVHAYTLTNEVSISSPGQGCIDKNARRGKHKS